MCEPPEIVQGAVNSSSVEDLRDPIPGLFAALTTAGDATNDMWSVVTYPAYESLLHHKNFGVSVDEGIEISCSFTFSLHPFLHHVLWFIN